MLACLFIVFAVLFTSFRALTPLAKQYKVDVEKKLSKVLGQTVHIQTMETSWYWFEPVLKLEKVSIQGSNQHTLKLEKLLVGIDVFQSLVHWQIQPGVLFIEDVNLNIYQKESGWNIDGIGLNTSENIDWEVIKPMLSWIFAQEKIVVKNVSALVHLMDGSILPFKDFHVTAIHSGDKFYLNGEAELDQTTPTQISFLANLDADDYKLDDIEGQIFISASRFLPAQWQALISKRESKIYAGEGSLKLWADIKDGKLSLLQSLIDVNHLMMDLPNEKNFFIKKFAANLAFNPNEDGWQLSGDDIQLTLDGKPWPHNKLLIRKNNTLNTLGIYLESLNLNILKKLPVPWTEQALMFVKARPYGYLKDIQLHLKDSNPTLFLSVFENIGIRGHSSIPGMSGISGAMSWQPEEGQFQIDTDALLVQPTNKPEVLFSKFNVSVSWKTLAEKLRFSLDNLVLAKKDFVLTANGRIDDTASPNRYIDMESLFSVEQAEQWLQYIPSGVLKPKLEQWLKEDIYEVGQLSGQVDIQGHLSDFPFDKQEGLFKINGYVENSRLKFKNDWPEAKNINAYIELNQRDLDLDLVSGEILDIQLSQADLKINDIGHDREVLLFRTKNKSTSEKISNLIFNSPLKKRLSKLNMLNIKGPVELDLMLEIPLYPENDKILAQGELNFLGGQVDIVHERVQLNLENLNGLLMFDELGVTKSAVKGELFGNLFDFDIHSARGLKPYIEIMLRGSASITSLKKRFAHSIWNLVEGELPVEGRIKITDETDDLDSIQFKSNLKGLTIKLPAPFGKKALDKKLLNLDLGYNPDKLMSLLLSYENTLSANLMVDTQKNRLKTGDIRIGQDKPGKIKNSGVQIIGTLKQFDLDEWKRALSPVHTSQHPEQSILGDIDYIDLELEKANLSGLQLNDFIVKAKQSDEKGWAIKVKHRYILADLFYQPSRHLLSGHFDKFQVDPFINWSGAGNKSQLHPSQLPNLNLTIDNLSYTNTLLGDVIIKGNSKPDKWQLNYFKILSPSFQLNLDGEWVKKDKKNQTKLQARLLINKLSDALKQFHIEPVVEAKHGEVNFRGGWKGSFNQVSLEKLSGNMDIKLRNGRITKLNPETEEKLGLGKLLSILSLQTIPRRLSLDFSDLSKSGYSFDIFKGKYKVHKGVMTTQDSYIDGPVAHASIKGSLDLKHRLYDLNLHVSPHITASLPIVATIAGGPVAGVAAWVASKLINHGMQKISGYTYKITGPWLEPVVQQVSIIKKRTRE